MPDNNQFQNPKVAIARVAQQRKLESSLPAVHPKINSWFDGIPYAHEKPEVGYSLGLTEDEAIILADKFEKAEQQARAQFKTGLVSHIMAILMPQLTPKEIVFAVSHLVCTKLDRGMI